MPANEPDDLFWAYLFSHDTRRYMGSAKGIWDELQAPITAVLESTKLPTVNIRVGVVTCKNPTPTLQPIGAFLKKLPAKSWGRQILVLLVDSDAEHVFDFRGNMVSLKGIPTLPKAIATVAHHATQGPDQLGELEASTWRRLMSVAANGGVVLPLLSEVELRRVRLSDFDLNPALLNLAQSKQDPTDIATQFVGEIYALSTHVTCQSNEAEYSRFFWSPLLSTCLRLAGGSDTCKLKAEWPTGPNLHEAVDRKVDMVAVVSVGGKDLPVLLVEAGRETVQPGLAHKDLSKICSLLTIACLALAHHLRSRGRRPELAIVYGMFIGGDQCQFLVARAVVRQCEDGRFEIYCNISYHDHWIVNVRRKLLGGADGGCIKPCCRASAKFDFLSFDDFDVSDANDGSASTDATATESVVDTAINLDALKAVKWFVAGVKKTADGIHSLGHDGDDDRDFLPRPNQAASTGSRSSSTRPTPAKDQTKAVGRLGWSFDDEDANVDGSPTSSPLGKRERIRKKCAFEAEVYLRCSSTFPTLFPRIFSLRPCPDGEFEYTFEHLERLYCSPDWFGWGPLNQEFFAISLGPGQVIANCAKFAINTLHGLHLLHSHLKIVHSDVSPNNIMYSHLDGTWKLIDFDHSWPLKTSLKTLRHAGTRGFRPSECDTEDDAEGEKGRIIFDTCTDLFSLGSVMNFAFDTLLGYMSIGLLSQNKCLHSAASELRSLFSRMIRTDLSKRPCLLDCLKVALSTLQRIDGDLCKRDLSIVAASNLVQLESYEDYDGGNVKGEFKGEVNFDVKSEVKGDVQMKRPKIQIDDEKENLVI